MRLRLISNITNHQMTTSLAERPILIKCWGVSKYWDSCNWTFCDDWSLIRSDGERAIPNEDICLDWSPQLLSIICDEKCMQWIVRWI